MRGFSNNDKIDYTPNETSQASVKEMCNDRIGLPVSDRKLIEHISYNKVVKASPLSNERDQTDSMSMEHHFDSNINKSSSRRSA